MFLRSETIAAVATGLTDSGISIIRVSGFDSFTVVDKIFKMPSGKALKDCESHTIHYGFIYDQDEIVDENNENWAIFWKIFDDRVSK